MRLRKLSIAVGLIISLSYTNTAMASLSNMQKFFDDIGAYSNSASPDVFKGQTRNYVTGGSLSVRAPNKTYQLATFDPPRIGASCSGIDIFGGAFSFINSEQLVQMMQNIGNNAVGAIFALALESVSPQLNSVMKFFQDLSSKINALNINSCEAATGIVQAAADGSLMKSGEAMLKGLGSEIMGIGDDWSAMTESFQKKSGSGSYGNTLDQAKNSDSLSEDEKMWIEPGNLLFKALAKLTSEGITNDEKLLIQSLIGTVIIKHDKDGEGNPQLKASFIPPLYQDPLNEFTSINENGKASIPIHKCMDSNCDEISLDGFNTVDVTPFGKIIGERIRAANDKVHSRDAPLTDAEIKMINLSTLPIWSMIETSYRTGASGYGLLSSSLQNAEEALVLAYLKALLYETTQTVRIALRTFDKAGADAGVPEQIEKLESSLKDVEQQIARSYQLKMNDFQVVMAVENAIALNAQRVREVTAKQINTINR